MKLQKQQSIFLIAIALLILMVVMFADLRIKKDPEGVKYRPTVQEQSIYSSTQIHFREVLLDNYNFKDVNYTFQDPGSYEGPEVKGWPPKKSRDMKIYIRPNENTITSDVSCLDLSKTKVLIMIQSAPGNFNRRDSNRRTWMTFKELFPGLKTLFVFGIEQSPTDSISDRVQLEKEKYCDIIQMDFIDTYENVTLDTVSALKFVHIWPWEGNQVGPDYLILGDDDVYVNIPALWHLLYEGGMEKDSKYLTGFRFKRSQVLRPKDSGAKIVDKIICPTYMYNQSHYPDSMGGALYVLPQATLSCLFAASLKIPYFHINDIHVTGFAAEMCDFERKNHQGFHPGALSYKDIKSNDISIHWIRPERKAIVHHILKNQNGSTNLKIANAYFFNAEKNQLQFCDKDLSCEKVQW